MYIFLLESAIAGISLIGTSCRNTGKRFQIQLIEIRELIKSLSRDWKRFNDKKNGCLIDTKIGSN